jgi:glycosyltransferase involved in cell wall biosynthesis
VRAKAPERMTSNDKILFSGISVNSLFSDSTDPKADLDADLAFIEQFQKAAGRPLRVLHIGNIANNAYNNALIQRRFGIAADTICYDYYHVMGCPEWEAATFSKAIDNFFPDWWATELGGWQRPDWFVQGPLTGCLAYLRARNAGDNDASGFFWKVLQAKYWELLDGVAFADGRTRPEMPDDLRDARTIFDFHFANKRSIKEKIKGVARSKYHSFLAKNAFPHLRRETELGIASNFYLSLFVWRQQRRMRGLSSGRDELYEAMREIQAERHRYVTPPVVKLPLPDLDRPEFSYLSRFGEGRDDRSRTRDALVGGLRAQYQKFSVKTLDRVEEFSRHFASQFADVLSYYDVIQGYATDGFIPYVNGFENFVCYEHGTLRDIPFEESYNAILCMASYKNAKFSLVTNSDVLPSAARMGLEETRTVYLPHAFDDQKIVKFQAEFIPRKKAADEVVTLFCPTRHHWYSEPSSMRKGNEVFIAGAADAAKINRNFRIVLVEWGVDVGRSKELIRSLGIEDLVSWIPTLNKSELRQAYCNNHAVIDQFLTPAMGGVTFEAMALGRRVMTRIDMEQTTVFFGAPPPCLTADSAESCSARILQVVNDPDDRAGIGRASAVWFETYHSARRTVALQAKAYRSILADRAIQRPEVSKPGDSASG